MLPYIRFSYDETRNAKKAILESEMIILNIKKRAEMYKKIRMGEFAKKSALKRAIHQSFLKISSIIAEMPSLDAGNLKNKGRLIESESTSPKASNRKIELELEEIREKLKSLS